MSAELDEIWKNDFFERRKEAELLEQYLESVWKRPNLREDSNGFVLAVDADYGMGKTFFLTRFAKQMAMNHPVAYIDAWKDDLHDEPMIAILATLEEALEPYFKKKPEVEQQFKTVVKKAQKIGGLIVKGVAFRALGAIFTPKIVDFIADTLSSNDTQIDKDDLETTINDAEKDAIAGAGKVSEIIKEESDLRSRISKLKESKSAIEDMKNALRQLVESLKTNDETYAPIVIIIDELDRCRPTYAIKLLEEVKHLFDVEGLVFVLGTNKSQLSKAVSHSYGRDFDGYSYLGRFFDRQYKLKPPIIKNLILLYSQRLGLHFGEFSYPTIVNSRGDEISHFSEIMAGILSQHGISARDTVRFLYDIKTAQILTQCRLQIVYLTLVWIKMIKGEASSQNRMTNEDVYIGYWDSNLMLFANKVSLKEYYEKFESVILLTSPQIREIMELKKDFVAVDIITSTSRLWQRGNIFGSESLENPKNYQKLLNEVTRLI